MVIRGRLVPDPVLTDIEGMAKTVKRNEEYKTLGRTPDGVMILAPKDGGKASFTLNEIRTTIRKLRDTGQIPSPKPSMRHAAKG